MNSILKSSIRISGKPIENYRIVISENASSAVRYAANQLGFYISKTIGDSLETVTDANAPSEYEILVGVTNRRPAPANVKNEDFEVAAYNGQLVLCGKSDRSTIYAVYDYLEKYVGWRWFAPDCELKRENVSSEIYCGERYVERPFFAYRDTLYDVSLENHDFLVKCRSNTDLHEPIPESMGGGIVYNGFCHTFRNLCPADEYFDSHPEYYALRNGKRVKEQLCLSNPDTLKIVTENALSWLRAKGGNIISISQNDNVAYCTCDECRKSDEEEGSPCGTLLRFVNKAAEAIEKEFPDVLVKTLAYQYTRETPKITRPRKNMVIMLCSYERCCRHPLDDADCVRNIAFKKDIENWNSVCDRIYIWDYVTNFSHYMSPIPNISVLRKDMQFFATHSVEGVLSQGVHNALGADFCELKNYLLCKLHWNPFMSDEEYEYHICDFLSGFYGKGWEYIREYLRIANETTYDEHFTCFDHPSGHFKNYIKNLDEIFSLLDNAYELGDETQKIRVRRLRLAPLYISICSNHDERKQSEPEKLRGDKLFYYEECAKLGVKRCEWFQYAEIEKINIDNNPEKW